MFLPRAKEKRKKEEKKEKKKKRREKGEWEEEAYRKFKEEEEGVLMPSSYITYHGKQRKTAKKWKRYNKTLILVDPCFLVKMLFICLGVLIMISFDDLGCLKHDFITLKSIKYWVFVHWWTVTKKS